LKAAIALLGSGTAFIIGAPSGTRKDVMSRTTVAAALATLLMPTVALAAAGTSLTIYHSGNDALFTGGSGGTIHEGHALVHATRALDVGSGTHQLRIGNLPATVDPEAISVGFGKGSDVSVLGQRVVLANARTGAALDSAIGSQVRVVTAGAAAANGGGSLTGTLLGASGHGLLLRTPDGKVHLLHRYQSVTLPAGAVSRGSSLLLDFSAKTQGTRHALLTYTTSGLGWRAAYTAILAHGATCAMQFKPEASIANRSGRDYGNATVKLVAGQPNLGNHGIRFARAAGAPVPMAASVRQMPKQASLGDYRSFTLPGAVNLPDGTVTLTPLYRSSKLDCQRAYVVEDGGSGFPPKPRTNESGAGNYTDRPVVSSLSFTAPQALPAGTLRAWIVDPDGAPELLGEGNIADTPKGRKVSVQLGQSFDLRVSRERTGFHVDARAHKMKEAYTITLTNGGEHSRTVTVREHPNRWHQWSVIASSTKPSKKTPQLLEFKLPVPAHGKATLSYRVLYTWTKDM
jgi:hypothetical protein